MPDLRIRFVTESGFVAGAIRWVTFSEFSHTELELPDGTWLGAHAGSGVQIHPANYYNSVFERRYAIPLAQTNYDAAMKYALAQIGTPYNYSDIAGLLFHRNMTGKGRAICSQFVFDVMQAGGLQPLNVLSGYDFRVTPDTLHLSPLFIGRAYLQTEKP
jgi:hypothetical protein